MTRMTPQALADLGIPCDRHIASHSFLLTSICILPLSLGPIQLRPPHAQSSFPASTSAVMQLMFPDHQATDRRKLGVSDSVHT